MAVLGFPCFVAIALVLGLLLNAPEVCNGGKTSTFVRKVEKTVDMPLDSDVFAVPPGYNAPQQVTLLPVSSLAMKIAQSWNSQLSDVLRNQFIVIKK